VAVGISRKLLKEQAARQHTSHLPNLHPKILSAYMSGDLVKMIDAKITQKFKRQYAKLTADEIMVLAFLHKRLDALKAGA
jgi:hypothetical protein